MKKHQEISKAGSEQKFKGGLASTGEQETKYHTATHLLLGALRKVLNAEIVQKGSNITAERMRFDFNWPEKLTPEQLKKVEDLVNEKIAEKIPVEMFELPKEEAKKICTVLSFDLSKYGDIVKVYKVGNFDVEFCGGPHVKNTSELGHFKIVKEEASSAGVRRIKAILE
jgi:alanyl-tRNA synthetase